MLLGRVDGGVQNADDFVDSAGASLASEHIGMTPIRMERTAAVWGRPPADQPRRAPAQVCGSFDRVAEGM